MKKQVHHVFFSPTGTTRAVIDGICRGTGLADGVVIDLTHDTGVSSSFGPEDLVVVGMPVYAGRLPKLALERFAAICGNDVRVAAVVVYGNRAYDDALLELCDCCSEQGFRVVGAAAFVGEHSFSSLEVPIAQGRPDKEDLVRAEAFGQHVAAQLQALDLAEIPGNRPYKDNPVFPGAAAESDPEHCIRCGQCVEVCPADAITMSAALPETNAEECLWCEACVRACPTQSRAVVLPKIREVAERLHQTCSERREPSCYFEDAQC